MQNKIFGFRIDFYGGMSVSKDMIASKAFHKFTKKIQANGFVIKMIPAQRRTDPSVFLLGKDYSIENESTVDPLTHLPEGIHVFADSLRQFLEVYKIPIEREHVGIVSA